MSAKFPGGTGLRLVGRRNQAPLTQDNVNA